MKKIIFIFMVSFIFIFNVNASTFYLGERVPDMHIESIKGSNKHNGVPFILRRDDGEFVYCINPFDKINTSNSYVEYNYNDSMFNLTNEELNKMNLIAYYGYGYNNHTDLKWYGVTQFLIWKTLNLDDIYFTSTAEGGRINAYDNELREIEKLVNDYYTLPSFSSEHLKYTINNSYEIIDLNEVIDDYSIVSSNIESDIKNNKLYIDTKDSGTYEIIFRRKSPVDRNYLLYGLNGSQSLLYTGKINDIEFKITIEVISGSITINKVDSENLIREFAELEDAVYGIYSEDNLVSKIKTNKEGIAYIGNLALGKYKVKELIPSKGYELDENVYEIELTYDNKDITITSKENIIKGDIEFNKYYGDNKNYIKEDGAEFEIYDINDKLVDTYITYNGTINKKLEYGDYYVIQTKGKEGYKYIDKFNISVKENKKYSFDLFDDILIVEVPDTGKNDYHRIIPLILILLGCLLVFKSRKSITC